MSLTPHTCTGNKTCLCKSQEKSLRDLPRSFHMYISTKKKKKKKDCYRVN
jgi:hypothetical protein